MADVSNLISKGIGSPASKKFIITFGLGLGVPPTALTSLTVAGRGTGMTVRDREESLTVQDREETLTVRDR